MWGIKGLDLLDVTDSHGSVLDYIAFFGVLLSVYQVYAFAQCLLYNFLIDEFFKSASETRCQAREQALRVF